jgi:membrane-bound serine protease (ClpP class)
MVLNSGFGGFLLITLGIIFIYIELHLTTGLFAILATINFSLFFWSRFLGGTAGTLELVLFGLGLVLLALEVFVIPGFGVFGVSGILLTLLSLVMASNTFAGMTTTEKFNQSMGSLGQLAAALATVIVVAMVINRFLPTMPFVRRLILAPPGYAANSGNGPILNPQFLNNLTAEGPVPIGTKGFAASALKPSGKATFGDNYLDVVSDGAFIDHGTAIEVIRIAGSRIIVRASSNSDRPKQDSNIFSA